MATNRDPRPEDPLVSQSPPIIGTITSAETHSPARPATPSPANPVPGDVLARLAQCRGWSSGYSAPHLRATDLEVLFEKKEWNHCEADAIARSVVLADLCRADDALLVRVIDVVDDISALLLDQRNESPCDAGVVCSRILGLEAPSEKAAVTAVLWLFRYTEGDNAVVELLAFCDRITTPEQLRKYRYIYAVWVPVRYPEQSWFVLAKNALHGDNSSYAKAAAIYILRRMWKDLGMIDTFWLLADEIDKTLVFARTHDQLKPEELSLFDALCVAMEDLSGREVWVPALEQLYSHSDTAVRCIVYRAISQALSCYSEEERLRHVEALRARLSYELDFNARVRLFKALRECDVEWRRVLTDYASTCYRQRDLQAIESLLGREEQ